MIFYRLSRFSIDRVDNECYTPVQNNDINSSFKSFIELSNWAGNIFGYLNNEIYSSTNNLSAINSSDIFIPISPLFSDNGADGGSDVVLGSTVVNSLLVEHRWSLEKKCEDVLKQFPPPTDGSSTLLNPVGVVNMLVLVHIRDLTSHYIESVLYIESMLRKQLISAIGKEITPADFTEYMCYHNRKLFKEQYRPQPMCLSIRRSQSHSPEGYVSLLLSNNNNQSKGLDAPIFTLSKLSERNSNLMQFPLNSTTTIKFGGSRSLHTWLSHSFSDSPTTSLKLLAQARQFSSYIVLIGRISSATIFDPKYAIIVQNKDEITIPLSLRTIPTPKEFKDAIQSLSPEQQQLAKAFRGMQLESTLFGICLIQIKPHLEAVLKLPYDSLTKEIKLTQDLMKLFIQYQIPSDLLSFDGDVNESTTAKLAVVSKNVEAIKQMIEGSKEEEIEEKKKVILKEGGAKHSFCASTPSIFGAATLSSSSNYECSFGGYSATSINTNSNPPPPSLMRGNLATDFTAAPSNNPVALNDLLDPIVTAYSTENVSNDQTSQIESSSSSLAASGSVGIDYTKYPSLLDSLYSKYDSDNALTPSIIDINSQWTKTFQSSLLLPAYTVSLNKDELSKEKNNAFDLLDALSKSGIYSNIN